MSLLLPTLSVSLPLFLYSLFFFIAPPPSALSTLSLHDALPICVAALLHLGRAHRQLAGGDAGVRHRRADGDRKSTRLNSSHGSISYAVFCLKKKKVT